MSPLLNQCAWAASRTKGTYLRGKYERLVGRRGKKRAITAVGHKILIAAYFILRDKESYIDLGYEYLLHLNKKHKIKRHINQLRELGIEVDIKDNEVNRRKPTVLSSSLNFIQPGA